MSENFAHWPRIAKTWRLVGPPLRPSQHDIEFFNRAVARRNPQRVVEPIQALILGATPELFALRWPFSVSRWLVVSFTLSVWYFFMSLLQSNMLVSYSALILSAAYCTALTMF